MIQRGPNKYVSVFLWSLPVKYELTMDQQPNTKRQSNAHPKSVRFLLSLHSLRPCSVFFPLSSSELHPASFLNAYTS
jgi:hypothetical protein